MAANSDRTDAEWVALCRDVQEQIPEQIGKSAWEVVIAAALITSPQPQLLADFYVHLCQHQEQFRIPEEQRRLSLRLRDTILKLLTLVGAPRVISALIPLAKVEGEPEVKAKTSTLSQKWENVDVSSIHARGQRTIDTVYGPLLPKIFQTWGHHTQDIQFNTLFTVYGMYLSDFEVVTALETEAVVFTTIACTGLRGPSLWHMRGMGRLLGARGENESSEHMSNIKDTLRSFKVGIMTVVEWVGDEYVRRANLSEWVNVGDVVRDLGSWGDDEM